MTASPKLSSRLPDIHGHRMDDISAEEAEPATNDPPQFDINPALTSTQRSQMEAMLRGLPEAFARNPKLKPTPAVGIEHRIFLSDEKPIKQAPYRYPEAKKKIIKDFVDKLRAQKVISPSNSPWSSPVVLVRKPGKDRLCIDYRRLNAQTRKDAYPIPLIEDCLNLCSKAKWMSLVDIQDAFWHVPMASESKPLTAFVTPEGLFEWDRMPFGLCNAPATFQRYVDACLRGLLGVICIAFFDDCLVFGGDTFEEHVAAVRVVLQRLADHGLEAHIRKSKFGYSELLFVGHIISNGQVRPNPEKLRAVREFPVPTTVTGVKSFLGLTNYYHKFIPGFAKIAQPLYALTRKGTQFEWHQAAQVAFEQLKTALLQAPCLYAPDFKRPFILQTDASIDGLGAVLVQCFDDGEHPIAYVSRQLNKAERNYAATEWECLAVVWGIGQFEPYLIGAPFTVVTDHSALMWLPTKRFDNARITRWALKLQEFSFTVVHRAGTANANADALSRNPLPGTAPSEASAQENDGMPLDDGPGAPRFIRRIQGWRDRRSLQDLAQPSLVPEPQPEALCPRLVRSHLHVPFSNCETLRSQQQNRHLEAQARQVRRGPESAAPPQRLRSAPELTLIDEARVAGELVDAQYAASWEGSHIRHKLPPHELPQALNGIERRRFLQDAENLQLLPIRSSSAHTHALYYLPAQPRRGLASLVPPQPRLILPTRRFQEAVLTMMHDSPYGGHFGIKRTYAKIALRYYWRGMADDVAAWIAACPHCQQAKARRRNASAPVGHISPPTHPFEMFSMDHIGPLRQTSVDHFQYVLVVIDHFSGWAATVPMVSISAANTARVLVEEIFLRYGFPRRLLSDRGSAFRNELMTEICRDARVQSLFTSAEHPQTNGKVERLNGTLKQIISTCADVFGQNWADALPFATFAYNTSRSPVSGFSPFFLLYGFEAAQPGDGLSDNLDGDVDSVSQQAYANELRHNQQAARAFVESILSQKERVVAERNQQLVRVPAYQKGDRVYLSNPLRSRLGKAFTGPWLVDARLGKTTYRLVPMRNPFTGVTPRSPPTIVHVARLKPFHAQQRFEPVEAFPPAPPAAPSTEAAAAPSLQSATIRSEPEAAAPVAAPTTAASAAGPTPRRSRTPPLIVPTEPSTAPPDTPAASVLSRRRHQGVRLNLSENALMPDAPRPSSHSSHPRASLASRR